MFLRIQIIIYFFVSVVTLSAEGSIEKRNLIDACQGYIDFVTNDKSNNFSWKKSKFRNYVSKELLVKIDKAEKFYEELFKLSSIARKKKIDLPGIEFITIGNAPRDLILRSAPRLFKSRLTIEKVRVSLFDSEVLISEYIRGDDEGKVWVDSCSLKTLHFVKIKKSWKLYNVTYRDVADNDFFTLVGVLNDVLNSEHSKKMKKEWEDLCRE